MPIHIVLGHAERKGVDPKASSGRVRCSTRQPIQLVNQRVGHRIASTGNTVPVDQQLCARLSMSAINGVGIPNIDAALVLRLMPDVVAASVIDTFG